MSIFPKNFLWGAAGDIIGAPWLETIAAKEGNISVRNALSKEKIKMDFSNIPYAVFTSPQVASAGMKGPNI